MGKPCSGLERSPTNRDSGGMWILRSSSLESLECGAKHGVSMERGRFRSFSGMVQTSPTFGLEWENVKM